MHRDSKTPVESSVEARHVLYVEDNPRLGQVQEACLTQQGFRVTLVFDGKAALARVKASPALYDVVVTDFRMPGMSGLELARELTQVSPGLPIIMACGNVDDFTPEATAEAGIRRILLKPIRLQDLIGAIGEVLRPGPETQP